eukprot:1016623-Amphidinium_carterae.1
MPRLAQSRTALRSAPRGSTSMRTETMRAMHQQAPTRNDGNVSETMSAMHQHACPVSNERN